MTRTNGKRKKINKVTLIVLSVVITLGLVIGGTAMWGVNKFRDLAGGMYEPLPNGQDSQSGKQNKAKANELEGFHILILGVDSRDGGAARSDTVMIATVNPHLEEIMLTSLPRDTYVAVQGRGNTKLNHAMAYGGVPLAKETVERFLGIKVDHYLTIDFNGFQDAIDVLGGVYIDVERPMRYYDPTDGTNINIRAGYQLLDGKNALDYVRYRSDAEADFGRIRRQQDFIRAVAERATTFTQVTRVIPFVESASKGVRTDIHPSNIEALVRKFFGVRGTSIHSMEIESRSYIGTDGLWYVEIKQAERNRIGRALDEFKNKKPDKALMEQNNSQKNDQESAASA
ncbi:LCP family protein [Desulfuribacillus alkaliarsenatis]|uniref:Cell envelope-related transcriptional attenuator domain-containing protein n=1 Tax=Desulfuribacillus alkaliarsenatis TaxID=766136 RepID=A0A1E5G3L8_9FIRM|nr:LCP family protein [Desulfuribacillus alkaliarsenatis]OEF97653.1 hypothetical protein BHF68_14500 [Desulfuribacillus alkaliarsenatis]